jgi:hypothetical protein
MKSLDQVEPRTPISSLPFAINQSGSYYLTGNLQFTGASGIAIRIDASNVTLDLMGFTLSSTNAVGGDAIFIINGNRSVAVKNGTIAGNTTVTISGTNPNRAWTIAAAGFNRGITNSATGCQFGQLRISGCRSHGLSGGAQAMVENVTAVQNGGDGISVSGQSAVTNCVAESNGSAGIAATGSVTNCAARSNAVDGIFGGSIANSTSSDNGGDGIVSNGTITNCFANLNDGDGISGTCVVNSKALSNGGNGISAASGSVTSCVAFSNDLTGIIATSGVLAFCKASGNGADISASGASRTGNNPAP